MTATVAVPGKEFCMYSPMPLPEVAIDAKDLELPHRSKMALVPLINSEVELDKEPLEYKYNAPALIVVVPVKVLVPNKKVLPLLLWVNARADPVPLPSLIAPYPELKSVLLTPIKVKVTGVLFADGPVTLP